MGQTDTNPANDAIQALRISQDLFSEYPQKEREIFEREEDLPDEDAQLVPNFLSRLFSPPNLAESNQDRDLENVHKIVSLALESVDEGLLSEREGSALIKYVVACFAERRFNEFSQKVFSGIGSQWFVKSSSMSNV